MACSLSEASYIEVTCGCILVYRAKDANPDYKPDHNSLYPYWAGSVLGPIVYILAVVHALLWGFPSAILGSIVSFLRITATPNLTKRCIVIYIGSRERGQTANICFNTKNRGA